MIAAAMCDWLAGVFAVAVPADRIAAWRDPEGRATLEELGDAAGIGPEVAAALDALGDDAAAVEAAHHVLFSGLAGPATVAPYQSVHADGSGLLWQEQAAAMARLLAACGMRPLGVLEHEPPDHVAVQFALLAELLRRGDDDGARHLLRVHLLPWVPGFARACAVRDPQGFHAAAAHAAERLVAELARRLACAANNDNPAENHNMEEIA